MMTEGSKRENQMSRQGSQTTDGGASQSGDPGRTPGSAEGDRETVEEDLRDKSDKEQD
jgi:hypothetical protein